MAFRPGRSRAPRTTRFSAPSVPAADIVVRTCSTRLKSVVSPMPWRSSNVVHVFTGANGSMPLRDAPFQRRRSMAECSTRRSVVNDCNEPIEPPVRTSVTRSLARSSRSTKACSAFCVFCRLSNESPRSSTTMASVRCTSSRLTAVGRARGAAGAVPTAFELDDAGRSRSADDGHELREEQLLDFSVLPHLEIRSGEIRNDLAVAVGHDGIDAHTVGRHAESAESLARTRVSGPTDPWRGSGRVQQPRSTGRFPRCVNAAHPCLPSRAVASR